MFQSGASRYLCGEMYIDDRKRKNIVTALIQEMMGRGIKNVELAELTGWSTSKVSKLLSGKQIFTDDDLRVCARALGYTLDPFVDQGVDTRGFDIKKYVRFPMQCLEQFLEYEEDREEENEAVLKLELPLSIMGQIGLKATDYSVRTHISTDYYGDEEEICSWIKIWNRNIKNPEESYPVLSIWIDPPRDRFAMLVYLEGESNSVIHEVPETIESLKGIHNQIDFLFKEDADHHWLPDRILERTLSFDYWGKDSPLPDDDFFLESLAEVFKDYCDIVWDLKHIDLIPEASIFNNPDTATDVQKTISSLLTSNECFTEGVVKECLSSHEYLCEIDNSHVSFETSDGHQYAEVIPLIPFSRIGRYGRNIKGKSNAVCLCPNCAAQLKYGRDEDREEMLIGLHRTHKKELEEAGIKISLGELLKMYKL